MYSTTTMHKRVVAVVVVEEAEDVVDSEGATVGAAEVDVATAGDIEVDEEDIIRTTRLLSKTIGKR